VSLIGREVGHRIAQIVRKVVRFVAMLLLLFVANRLESSDKNCYE
jgi:hypothetical protein